ncbi:hypothetical protein PFBG_05265 [Plasmodium falciparum 7G8]|uniref:PPIase cyclophilin-type domain-containing protein n=1 Tax=Plasmodium falciparum (isolate 7G8) TaxID=57266 RepID=W7F838_PLAF8|nr:hypothetical protein PFBG_05265 [Plasmodium falciparum 7G8]
MSEVYSIEPKTHGKVIIYTSLGELEIHLFSNECPEACRNFIQHCLNNYYNKNEFFRVIPRFLIQTGDHTNTGLHNEYAFSSPFKNEYNSRLKFLYTGCLSFANLNIDKPSNGSQFFITLDKAEYLNNKNTLFGKVAKHSIYNLLKFNNIKTNKHDKPIEDIPYIEYVKIIENPFHHLVPSINYEYNTKNQNVKDKNEYLNKTKKKKEQNLLSFDYDQEISDDSETFFRGDKDQTVKQKNVSSKGRRMENYNIEDVVMIYGHKAIIESIQNVENVKSEIQPNKIYVGKYVNKKGYSDGTYRKKKIYTPQNDELVILCSYNSIKPYNGRKRLYYDSENVQRISRKKKFSFFCLLHRVEKIRSHTRIYNP